MYGRKITGAIVNVVGTDCRPQVERNRKWLKVLKNH